MLCTTAINTSNTIKNTDRCRPNATPAVGILIRVIMWEMSLQCFDAVGWAAGRASGL